MGMLWAFQTLFLEQYYESEMEKKIQTAVSSLSLQYSVSETLDLESYLQEIGTISNANDMYFFIEAEDESFNISSTDQGSAGRYYYGRSGGWPHLFIDRSDPLIEQKVAVSKYYDVVNFARFLTQPGFYAWGFNDIVCCPSSTFSAYNVITAPKTLKVARDTGHWLYPWQTEQALQWLKARFGME